ncbi:methionine--tRNA ligase, mitochondrial [Culicoides brevitarsis]|uniref:methionine--tRNA ligase, mitochondrial n=1 Tax=Culicoides brevitarsis TaxID=469753 RepID=UPI00307C5F5E
MKFINKISQIRHLVTQTTKPHYVTTPIFYVNAAPHIGHLYSSVIADAISRFERLLHPDRELLFSTGTDEHGSKIQQAAARNNITTGQYCDLISSKYRKLFDEASVCPSRFIRTTDSDHKTAVQAFWRRLSEKNLIYTTNYSGWYCVSDECFLSEDQLKQLPSGERVSDESGHPVEWTEERNYMFKLSAFQDEVVRWAESDSRIKPLKYQKILLHFLREPLPDISVSRPKERVSWGIDVPGDASQTIYVWLDALVNYLTSVGYPNDTLRHWPPDVQVLGKDILKFHGIYWPAFLIAAGMEPPRELFVHSHWTVDDQKMSKSKFNVVDPFERAGIYTMEGLRYFLLHEGVAHSDGNYSDTKIFRMLNAELADTLGNLLSRCCAKVLNPRQIVPFANFELDSSDEYREMQDLVQNLPEICLKHYREHNFYLVIDSVMACLHANNKFFEATKPWELRKTGKNEDLMKLDAILGATMENLRICGIILQPIIPKMAGKLLDKLNVPAEKRFWADLQENINVERPLGSEQAALFQRIYPQKASEVPKTPKKVKNPNKKKLAQ